jgi:hypothetical protein
MTLALFGCGMLLSWGTRVKGSQAGSHAGERLGVFLQSVNVMGITFEILRVPLRAEPYVGEEAAEGAIVVALEERAVRDGDPAALHLFDELGPV